jgi:hypothetical protein
MAKKFFWKIWLRPNLLTKDVDNDYIAEVSTVGNTLCNEDIARQIVKGRSELRYETILSILNERDTVECDTIVGGSSAQDGNPAATPAEVESEQSPSASCSVLYYNIIITNVFLNHKIFKL